MPLRRTLSDHIVVTLAERSWDCFGDRELLDNAEADGFDVLVTTDQNLRHQQTLNGRRLAVLVLRTTNWQAIAPLVKTVATAVAALKPGSYVELSFPRP